MFQNIIKIVKTSYSFNYFKRRKKWYYLAAKSLSALLRAITSKHHDDFCRLNFLHSFATETKIKSHV